MSTHKGRHDPHTDQGDLAPTGKPAVYARPFDCLPQPICEQRIGQSIRCGNAHKSRHKECELRQDRLIHHTKNGYKGEKKRDGFRVERGHSRCVPEHASARRSLGSAHRIMTL